MSNDSEVTSHYQKGDLLGRLQAALSDDGVDPEHPTLEDLAHYDHFHGRGLEATREMADALDVKATDHILDVGSGIGGPARYFADRFGCRVTGIDLTAEFCEVARALTARLDLEGRVSFEQGNALTMPFADASFAGAYSMNVSMNIASKEQFYAEIHRVLQPGGWLVLSELALGSGGGPDYPTPWALSARTSFLATPTDTLAGLEASGFQIISSRDTVQESLDFGARSRAMVERGEKPPHRAVMLIHGDIAAEAMSNMTSAVKNARLVPVEIRCRKPNNS